MLRTLVIIAIAVITTSAIAQEKGDIAVGANLGANLGKVVNQIGYGVKVQYNIADNIRLEPSYTYYNKAGWDVPYFNIDFNSWECGINAHYLIRPTEKDLEQMSWIKNMILYPLAGVGLINVKCTATDKSNKDNNGSVSTTSFGVNLGIGADLRLSNKFSLNFQIKYMLTNVKFTDYDAKLGSRCMVHLGAAYRL